MRIIGEIGILCGALAVLALAAVGAQRVFFPGQPLSPDIARSLDAGLAPLMREQVVATRRVVSAPLVTDFFSKILKRLRAAAAADSSGAGSPAAEVLVIESPEINAFTLPGGLICVDTGLIRAMETAEEMSGVLAHELGHVVRRDPLAQLGRQLGMATVAGALSGGRGATVLSSMVQTLVHVHYGRDAEDRADESAVSALARAGIPPESFAKALARLRDVGSGMPDALSWIDPHAPLEERIARAEERARLQSWSPRPLGVDWEGVVRALPPP